jgi:hypothetical protein
MRRGLIGGGVFAALWFLFGWAPRVLSSSDGRLAALARVIPSPMSRGVFGASPLWMIVVQVLMAVAAIAGFALLVSGLSAGRTSFASGWLAAILTAVVIGAALDLGSFFSEVGSLGIRGAISTMGTAPLTAWWAVWAGWIPALVTMRPGSAVVRRRAGVPVWGAIALTTVVALIALPFAAEAGHRASQEQLREDLAAEEAAARANRTAPRRRIPMRSENPSRPRHSPRSGRPRTPAHRRIRRSWRRRPTLRRDTARRR